MSDMEDYLKLQKKSERSMKIAKYSLWFSGFACLLNLIVCILRYMGWH